MKLTVDIIPIIIWFNEKGFTMEEIGGDLIIENKESQVKLIYNQEKQTLNFEYIENLSVDLEIFKNSNGAFEIVRDKNTLQMDEETADKLRLLLKKG